MPHVQQTPVPPQASPLSPGRPRRGGTTGVLVRDLTRQLATLMRDELVLAQAEMSRRGKRAGLGGGLLSAPGALGVTAFGSTEVLEGVEEDVATLRRSTREVRR